jgi:hypothetical protein
LRNLRRPISINGLSWSRSIRSTKSDGTPAFPLHPAHYWTGINGIQKADFVGRTECFEQDFDSFCSQVQITQLELGNANVSADLQGPVYCRHLNRMNAASISKINAIFSADFELFGYEKHGVSAAQTFDLATASA